VRIHHQPVISGLEGKDCFGDDNSSAVIDALSGDSFVLTAPFVEHIVDDLQSHSSYGQNNDPFRHL
jgi:hypothetical protein